MHYRVKKIFILLMLLAVGQLVYADSNVADINKNTNRRYYIRLDAHTIARGYTVDAFKGAIKLSLVPNILNEATGVDIIELHENMPDPWQLERISRIYQFEFKNKASYNNRRPFYIQLSYSRRNNNYKQVFFYDKNYNTWRPLPTRDYPQEQFVRSLIHLPFARIAVFFYPDVLTVGRASWYVHQGGNFAASPDFPKGSRLRVYNRENNKFVDVKVNDYGPDRSRFPDRVIDLDRVAFSQLAPAWQGTIDIRVEPLFIAPDGAGRILGVPPAGVSRSPNIGLKAAVVMREKTGKILWSKNAAAVLPLASLTKLVAVKVFLDAKPSLNRVVAYNVRDEEYNYEHCKRWESTRVELRNGETATVEDLLYASLIGSANNTIETLVRVSGMSRDDFIAEMNSVVAAWGASTTHFIEPTGLAPENVSSALDYAIISREVLKHPIIQKASVMAEYRFSTLNTGRSFHIKNTNHIIKTFRYNITGSKTGYLDEAGYCLMTRVAASIGENIIVVTLGASSREDSFAETEELIKYGLRKYNLNVD